MMRFLLIVFFAAFFMFSCKQKAEEKNTQTQQQQQAAEPIELTTTLADVRIRDVAGLNGKEIEKVNANTKLLFLNEISDFTDKIKLRNVEYDDPWLKVRTPSGTEGWVYGGAVKFKMDNAGKDLYEKLVTRRLERIFGKVLLQEIIAYQDAFNAAKTDKSFAEMHTKGRNLLEKLNEKVGTAYTDLHTVSGDSYPDLFWIDDPLPAIQLELVAEGTEYQLFMNYGEMAAKAKTTAGAADDNFTNLMLLVFPDSVEYYFSAWFLQTWDYGGYSLLGQGIHTKVLDKMQEIAKESTLFNSDIQRTKTQLIEDIAGRSEYGEKTELILAELDNILAKNYSFFTKDDFILLKNRRAMFENPAANKIEVFVKDL